MANLFPDGYETEIIEQAEAEAEKPVGYRPGVYFDFEQGDFLLDGKNRMLDSDGVESWKAWCNATVMTERYKHLAYSSDIGLELDLVFRAKSREEAESVLTRQITEALLADPYKRTEYVEEIEIDWDTPDSAYVRVKVKGINGVSIDFTSYITKGEG